MKCNLYKYSIQLCLNRGLPVKPYISVYIVIHVFFNKDRILLIFFSLIFSRYSVKVGPVDPSINGKELYFKFIIQHEARKKILHELVF